LILIKKLISSTKALLYAGINHKIHYYEVLLKTKVDYFHFKVFGCRVFFYISKTLKNKFDNNALPGIFLVYQPYSPAYKILNLSNNNSKISTIIPVTWLNEKSFILELI